MFSFIRTKKWRAQYNAMQIENKLALIRKRGRDEMLSQSYVLRISFR